MNININLFDSGSINDAVKRLKAYADKLDSAGPKIEKELAEIGEEIAQTSFANALYAGTNDVLVSSGKTKGGYKVSASGSAVTFIEFGSGIVMGQGYPGTRPAGFELGKYGKGGGSHPPWVYIGEIGDNPPPGTSAFEHKPDHVFTHGNPPAAGMAKAAAEMRVEMFRVVKGALK